MLTMDEMVWLSPSSTRPPPSVECQQRPRTDFGRDEAPSEQIREYGNPATPGRPEDLKYCDLTAMGEKLLGVMYATDEWIEPDWDDNVPPRDNSGLSEQQKPVAKWWGGRMHQNRFILGYSRF